jgi:excisionase family DNA binding protein
MRTLHVLTLEETAAVLRVPTETLRRPWWRRRYGIPAIRIGGRVRFLESDVRAWLEQNKEPVARTKPTIIEARAVTL